MHKAIYLSILNLLSYALFIPSIVYADSYVHVQTSTSGGDSSTTVNNSVQSSSTNTSSSSNNTSIHINSNGQEYDYQSDQPGNVTIQDTNGNVTVNGSQTTVTPAASTDTTMPTTKPQVATPSVHHSQQHAHTTATASAKEKVALQHFDFFQFLKNFFSKLF